MCKSGEVNLHGFEQARPARRLRGRLLRRRSGSSGAASRLRQCRAEGGRRGERVGLREGERRHHLFADRRETRLVVHHTFLSLPLFLSSTPSLLKTLRAASASIASEMAAGPAKVVTRPGRTTSNPARSATASVKRDGGPPPPPPPPLPAAPAAPDAPRTTATAAAERASTSTSPSAARMATTSQGGRPRDSGPGQHPRRSPTC